MEKKPKNEIVLSAGGIDFALQEAILKARTRKQKFRLIHDLLEFL